MSKLLDIKLRVEKLPLLRKQKQNNVKVVAFQARVDLCKAELLACASRRNCFHLVFPGEKLKATTDAVRQSRKQAASLVSKLKEDFDAIGSADTDKKITRIKERNDLARVEISKNWRSCVEKQLKPFEPLIEIASEAALPGHESMVAKIDALRCVVETPPTTIDQAQQIRDNLEELGDAIANLELEGPGGEFLRRAVRGRANPRDLFKEEVRQFLDEKSLWNILIVKTK